MKETPSQLVVPSFLLNYPTTLSVVNPNNIWMKEATGKDLIISPTKAQRQFMDLYNFMAGESLVYLLPTGPVDYQDQTYVANVGCFLPHIRHENNIVVSNFKSEPRRGEEKVAIDFFKLMNYNVHQCPTHWEGEADLKYLRDNIYIMGHGIRTDLESHAWFAEQFAMDIISLQMADEYLYHLDCSIFPLARDKIICCTEMFTKREIRKLEKVATIIDVDVDCAYNGTTNCVRLGNMMLCASNMPELEIGDELYDLERHKIGVIEKICASEGIEPVFINLSEYLKSGAMLSCLVMHLNYVDYEAVVI